MLVLKGINTNAGMISVYDSDDNSVETVYVHSILREIYNGKIVIRGLEPYYQGVMYPPDSKFWSDVNLVVIPSRATLG